MAPVFKALSITEQKQKTPLTFLDYEEPELKDNEILVENVAVAQNPVDWKQLDFDYGVLSLPWTNGGDIAGKVYKVGSGVKDVKVGNRVISYLSRISPRHGGYQTYTVTEERRTFKLPESYSFEDGSTIPLAYTTAVWGLVSVLDVSVPTAGDPLPLPSRNEPLLVWGGASSVGAYVIQVAVASGYTVITTASKANHEYVKSLGATHAFDYHDTDVVEQIRKVAGPNLSLAYDAVSLETTVKQAASSLTSPSGGTIAVILPDAAKADLGNVKENVKATFLIAGGAFQNDANYERARPVFALLDRLLNAQTFKPTPVKIISGGLNGVQEGWNLGRAGKISAEKLVYRISESTF